MKFSQLRGVTHALRRLLGSERGQGMVEYALIVSVVALGSLAALQFLGGSISDLFDRAGSQLSAGAAGGSGGTGAGGTPPPGGTPVNGGNGGTPGGGGLPPAGTPGNNNNPVFNTNPTAGPPGFTGTGVQGIFWGEPGDVPPTTFPVTVTELGDTITVSGCRVHITTPTTFDFYGVWIREPSSGGGSTDWRFTVGGTDYEWACIEAPAFTLVNGSESGASFNSRWTGATVGANITGQARSSQSGNDQNAWYNANTNTTPAPANTNKPGVYDNNGPGWTASANYYHPSNGTVWLCYWQGTPNYTINGTGGLDNGCLAASPPPALPEPGNTDLDCPGNDCESGELITADTSNWDENYATITNYRFVWATNDTPNASCSGSGWSDVETDDWAPGTTQTYQLPADLPGAGDAEYRVRVYAQNSVGDSTLFTADCTTVSQLLPGQPNITGGPTNSGNSATYTSPSFTFTAGANTTSLECSFDGGGYSACTSPQSYGPLAVGTYSFSVRGVGVGGSGSADTSTWSVVVPGAPNITGGPSGSGSSASFTSPVFTWSAASNSTGHECRIDGGSYASCTSGQTFGPVGLGAHTFNVRGTSPVGAGAADSQAWTVTAPVSTFTGGGTTNLGGLANPTTTYGYINQSNSLGLEASRQITAAANLTITEFHVALTSGSSSYTVIVRVNGSNVAALTCTTGALNDGTCDITGQSVSVNAGQTLVIQVNKVGSSSTNRTASWTVTYTTP